MKLKRKIIALAMAATFTISMVSTAFADTPPHLMYGTIRVSKDTLTFIDFCLYLENLTRIF
ncbi:MAG: hypothetical protein ACLUFH_02055 [Monoglobales bacterium]